MAAESPWTASTVVGRTSPVIVRRMAERVEGNAVGSMIKRVGAASPWIASLAAGRTSPGIVRREAVGPMEEQRSSGGVERKILKEMKVMMEKRNGGCIRRRPRLLRG